MMNSKAYLRWLFAVSTLIVVAIAFIACSGDSEKKTILITGILSPKYHPDVGFPRGQNDIDYVSTVLVAYYQESFVEDASVKISSSAQEVELEPVLIQDPVTRSEMIVYQDKNNLLKAISGETYNLMVELDDGRIFTSQTTVPQTPTIHFPVDGAHLVLGLDVAERKEKGFSVAKIPFEYERDKSSSVQMLVNSKNTSNFVGRNYSLSEIDTALVTVSDEENEVTNTICLATLDSAFSRYSWRLTRHAFSTDDEYDAFYTTFTADPENSSLWSNIEGENVVGCFGSYSFSKVQFSLKRP